MIALGLVAALVLVGLGYWVGLAVRDGMRSRATLRRLRELGLLGVR